MAMDFAMSQLYLGIMRWSASHGNQLVYSKTSSHVSTCTQYAGDKQIVIIAFFERNIYTYSKSANQIVAKGVQAAWKSKFNFYHLLANYS